MKMRTILYLLSLFVSSAFAHDESKSNAGAVLNKDGSIVTGILAPAFDPLNQVLPFPHNLFFQGTGDLTINLSGADPTDFSDPFNVLGALDGFSTTEKWTAGFVDRLGNTGDIDPSTVIPGHSVRVFQVTTQQIVVVTGIVKELIAGVDFVAAVIAPGVIGIIPLKPLAEYSSYMAVMTNDIKDMDGNDATPDTFYHLAKSHTPWIGALGNSTTPLLDNASAQALEGLRQITATQEGAAAAAGIAHEDIIISWTVQTQSITPTLKLLRSIATPAPTIIVPSGLNTSVIGAAGIADIMIGVISLPYYLGVPSAANPIAPLTDFWTAPPGGYVPPFDQFGFDPTSTHVTAINPFPVLTSVQTVPVLMTVPNAFSGMSKPVTGWPVVIFGHGLTRNRTDMLAMADAMALAGYAVIAIDSPLHGVVPEVQPELAPFWIGATPFAAFANERTFGVDYVNNTTRAPGPDGIPDPSGTHIFNLSSALTSRDNLRQGEADISILAVSISSIDINGDTIPDLDGNNIAYVGHSMGGVMGTVFTAIEPLVSRALLSVAGGGIARMLVVGSETYGPPLRAGLAAAGVEQGTALFEQFLTVFQTAIDSGDPINWSAEAAANNAIMLHEVIGDTVVPNFVATAPLSGTEPMIAAMGLNAYSTSQADPAGLKVVARFVPPATHASLLSPASPAAFFEMQGQMASFIASFGTFVSVGDETTMVQVLGLSEILFERPVGNLGSGKKGRRSGGAFDSPTRATGDRRGRREGTNK